MPYYALLNVTVSDPDVAVTVYMLKPGADPELEVTPGEKLAVCESGILKTITPEPPAPPDPAGVPPPPPPPPVFAVPANPFPGPPCTS
jgi:hypothetical protein